MTAAREAGETTAATDSNQQPKYALTADEMRDDRTLQWRGFQAAMLMYKDPALAMQHLLYCMMRELLVRILAFHVCKASLLFLMACP